jgi:hypothetical protein
MNLDEHRSRLVERCRQTHGVTSLVFFGSATDGGSTRRDEWSDLDFNLFAAPHRVDEIRREWPFLPSPDRIVLRAREHGDGGVVLYDDGVVYEFGAGSPWEIRDPHRQVVLDGGDLRIGHPPSAPDAANEVSLFLAKLYLGVGRARRGEVVSAGALVRTHAVTCLCHAIRARLAPQRAVEASAFDPLRRFEDAYPQLGDLLSAALASPVEAAGRQLFELARTRLEPGWPEFPSRAADLVAARFGW